MSRRPCPRSAARLAVIAVAIAAASACTTTAPAVAGATALVVGQQATIEGDVIGVDTDPWAYDGNAVVTVSTTAAGTVSVHLPARWNLCKAQPIGDIQRLEPGDRVQATGTVSAPGELVVCEQPDHRLQQIE